MSSLFNITHSAGDLSEYDETAIDGGDLAASATAALAGTNYGALFTIDDTNDLYALKYILKPTTFRCRFYLDPNSLTMANNTVVFIYQFKQRAGSYLNVVYFTLKYLTASGYSLIFSGYDDTADTPMFDTEAITDASHYVEFEAVRATNSTSSDGSYEWWIDGVSKGSVTGIDNYNRMADQNMRTGICAISVPAGCSGTFFMDEIAANDDGGEIGPVSSSKPDKRPLGLNKGIGKRVTITL